jgi:hypothetical protein
MSPRTRTGLLLLLIVAAGASLRVWYASGELYFNRFEDERYSLRNVRSIYHSGDLAPANAYYPSPVFNLPQVWLLKASQRLFRATGRPAFQAVAENGRLTPTGFLLTRLYAALCGILTLPVVFLLGRRLCGVRVGLIATLWFAFVPWTVHTSAYNKPDALLLLGITLALWTSMRALESGAVSDHAVAGLAIALAMSAKLTGGLVALPLVIGSLFFVRQPRRLGLLALAGGASAVAFVLTNPYWRAYLFFIQGLKRDYAGRTADAPWTIPGKVVGMFLESKYFGSIVGALAVAAALLLAIQWLAGPRPETRGVRAQRAAFLSFPVVYVAVFATQTSYFKPNNFLALLPFVTVALAWLLVELWQRSTARLADPLRRRAAIAGVAGLVLVAATPGTRYVYLSRVATTYDLAMNLLEEDLQPEAGRLVYYQTWQDAEVAWEGRRALHDGLSAVRLIDEPDSVAIAELAQADAVVLRRDSPPRIGELLAALRAEGSWRRIERPDPALFRLRGPPIVLFVHRRQLARAQSAEVRRCGARCLEADLPADLEPGEDLSLFVRMPARRVRLEIDGRSEPLWWASRKRDGHLLVSRHWSGATPGGTVRIVSDAAFEERLVGSAAVEVYRWRADRVPIPATP